MDCRRLLEEEFVLLIKMLDYDQEEGNEQVQGDYVLYNNERVESFGGMRRGGYGCAMAADKSKGLLLSGGWTRPLRRQLACAPAQTLNGRGICIEPNL